MLQHPCPAPSVRGVAARRAKSRFFRWLGLGAIAPALLLILWSCNSHPLQRPSPDPTGELAQYREINPIRNVDIVFVIDNSGSMAEEQANLARNFPVFMDELAGLQGADFHIASVTSDLGAGTGTSRTAVAGRAAPWAVIAASSAPSRVIDFCTRCGVDISQGRFLRTVNPNYTGDIRNVFTCMSTYGTGGCGFEHSIGALRTALMPPKTRASCATTPTWPSSSSPTRTTAAPPPTARCSRRRRRPGLQLALLRCRRTPATAAQHGTMPRRPPLDGVSAAAATASSSR